MLNHILPIVPPYNSTCSITESANHWKSSGPRQSENKWCKFIILFPLATHLFDHQLLATFAFINTVLSPRFWNIFSVHTEDYTSWFANCYMNKLSLIFFKKKYLQIFVYRWNFPAPTWILLGLWCQSFKFSIIYSWYITAYFAHFLNLFWWKNHYSMYLSPSFMSDSCM